MAGPGKEVAAIGPDGTPITVPASAVPALQASHGRVLSAAEEKQVRHRVALNQELDGLEGYVAPAAAGVARGLTFGLSDAALSMSPALRQRLADYEEYAPTASTGGEIAGMVGGSLLGVGPAGWAARGGRALEAGIVGGIGAESALARVGGKIAGGAAAGAFENGLYEAGKVASDAAISDEPLTAEKLVAGASHGVLFGGIAGGALGGLASLRGAGSSRALADISVSEATPARVNLGSGNIDLDAGLHGAFETENPFDFTRGPERRGIHLRPDVGLRGEVPTSAEGPLSINRTVGINPDAGLGDLGEISDKAIHPTGKASYTTTTEHVPLSDINIEPPWDANKLPPLRAAREAGVELDPIRLGRMAPGEKWDVVDGLHRIAVAQERGETSILARHTEGAYPQKLNNDVFGFKRPIDIEGGAFTPEYHVGIDPNAGIGARGDAGRFQGKIEATDALRQSSAKSAPRHVFLRGDLDAAAAADVRSPIRLPERLQPASLGEVAAAKGSIADQLSKHADVKTIKALGGSAGDLRALEGNVPGGFRRVAEDIRGDLEKTTGKSIGFHSRESLHEYATKRVEQLGEDLGAMLQKLDEAKTGIAPDPAAFVKKVRSELLTPNLIAKPNGTFSILPGQQKTVHAVEKWIRSVESAFSDRAPTFGEWQKIRRGLDSELKFQSAQVSPTTQTLRQMRGIMEGELMTAGERAAQEAGGNFAEKYQATKSLYQSVKKASELTERGVARDLANNSFGLTSRMAGIAGASVGTAIGGPVGGFIGGGIGGLVGKAVQSRGDVLAADLLSRAASIAGANRIAGRVSAELESGVRKLIPSSVADGVHTVADRARAGAAPLGIRLTGDRRGDYVKLSDVITSAVANPIATTDKISRSLGDLGEHSPATATAVVTTTLRGLDFLASKLPPSRQDQFSLQPQLQPKTRASDAELSRFMRYAQAVDDPLIVLREAKSGMLTRDHVEAVQTVYPKLYDEIRGSVMRQLVNSKSELPYARRIQLGILLDIPTDKTLSPAFQKAIQATFSADPAGAESPPPTSAAPDVASSMQTATQMAMEHAA